MRTATGKPRTRHLLNSFLSFLRRVVLASQLYGKNELQNHANAAAYSFLLSVMPVLLLIILILDRAVGRYPSLSENLFAVINRINPVWDKKTLTDIGLVNLRGTAVGVVGAVNLLWASRQIFVSINRGINIIFPAAKKRNSFAATGFSFIFVTVFVLIIIIMSFLNAGLNIFETVKETEIGFFPSSALLGLFRQGLPYLFAFLVIFLTYRFIPVSRPRTGAALQGAVFCTLSIFIIQSFFSRIFTVEKYTFIYGILGSLVLSLVAVQLIFVLYFLFAEFVYVSESFDVLILERLYALKNLKNEKGRPVERFLFRDPANLLARYLRFYAKGEPVFRQGDDSQDVYFLYSGRIGIYLYKEGIEDPVSLAGIGEVEIFGEMAYLLNEKRTATAVCEEDSTLFVLPPEIFEEFLKMNELVSYDIIRILSERLKKTNFGVFLT